MPAIMWFRRDLRLHDNPALLAAVAQAREDGDGQVLPLFVIDPVLWQASGPVRQAYLLASLASLDASLGGALVIRHGDPATVVPDAVRGSGASAVHHARDFGPYGQRRDAAVAAALGATPLVATGSPYAVAPGRVTKNDGMSYRVFSAYHRAWARHGWRAPAADGPADALWWAALPSDPLPAAPDLGATTLPPAGESAAWERWTDFRERALAGYREQRDRPDVDGTSCLSHHLRWGELHPRSLLAELGEADEVFRKELCWREFYADVLFHAPASATRSLDERFEAMSWASGRAAERAFDAWEQGRTGYPLVDAGMRQLRAEGWMHNRVRMVVASFLVKDLHLPWQRGAGTFMRLLRDGDLASNAHGWQWTAGCGTDAAPFYRIFNPVAQGLRFDPEGDYVRRYLPEVAHLPGAAAHEPWAQPDGYAHGYPERIVDHAVERQVALDAYQSIRQR